MAVPVVLAVPAVVLVALALVAHRRRRAVEQELTALATATRRLAALRQATAALGAETEAARARHQAFTAR